MNIYIGSLPARTSAKDITTYFKRLVKVLDLKRIKNKGRKSPGYAILKVGSRKDYDKLMSSPHSINGHSLVLKPYLTPTERLELEKSLIRKRVYVKNLPEYAPVDALTHVFSIFGKIDSVVVKKKQLSDATYGFITFEAESSAENCLEQGFIDFYGHVLEIKDYKINHSKFKKELSFGKKGNASPVMVTGSENIYSEHRREQGQEVRDYHYQQSNPHHGQISPRRVESEMSLEPRNSNKRNPIRHRRLRTKEGTLRACFQGYPRSSFFERRQGNWFYDRLNMKSIVRKDSYLSKKHDFYNLRFNKTETETGE